MPNDNGRRISHSNFKHVGQYNRKVSFRKVPNCSRKSAQSLAGFAIGRNLTALPLGTPRPRHRHEDFCCERLLPAAIVLDY